MLTILILAALASAPPPTASDVAALAHLVRSIDAEYPMRTATLGVSIVDAASGKTLFAQDADKEFAPASNFKLVDAASALAYLGPDFRYRTDLLERGTVQNGVLSGDLILRGGGDPVLSRADLERAAKAVVAAGITRITGTVLPDDRVFDRQRYGSDWAWDDMQYYYQPPIQALGVDEGLAYVTVTPGTAAGDPLIATIEPNGGVMTVRSDAQTAPKGGTNDVDCFRSPGSTQIEIVGHFPLGSAPFRFGCAVEDSSAYATGTLAQLLPDAGVAVGRAPAGPRVEIGMLDIEDPAFVAPLDLPVLWSHDSAPLHDIVAKMMPPSDNFIAEHLFKMLPVAAFHQRGTFDGGAAVERKFIGSLGLDPRTLDNGDGSGLSQGDRVTPHDLTTILEWETRSSTGHDFIDALALAGINGTVRHHLLGSDAIGRVRAKDGYIWHVSTFTGYAWTKNHGLVIFSIMFNDANGLLKPFQHAQDRIVETIVDWP
ncbi:MAG: D-alanyl-D-alanine carboxypeptidase/D-alanyl-D-alanine-endopeptidase [Candidatus Eremiobacterales bacterium]|jgi:D-alanyl-D-alanine carboxypeptidase/D-alanyl-D-alanine-endopeptidase (penicillin-binding protein 4)